MAKKPADFEVTCPCCRAVLKLDGETHAVLAHTEPPRPKTFNDLEEAARALREQDTRRESIFRQSVEAEKNRGDLLSKKFDEALKRAKDAPDMDRVRDIDLD
jgi:Zn-finger nucleic acid-binding protein